MRRPCRLRVAIPHYYRPNQVADGYGSTRAQEHGLRQVALARCLGGVLALARSEQEEVLEIAEQRILAIGTAYPEQRLAGVEVECHLFVTGDHWLAEVVEAFGARITVHRLALEDPQRLPFAARDFLLADAQADLALYLEDDLVVHDRLYADKLIWFYERTEHRYGLMPHRFELTGQRGAQRLFVDGPMAQDSFPPHQRPAEAVAEGTFWDGGRLSFDLASNPHSGSFALSPPQRQLILAAGVADSGFVGPLETVATYTVLQHLPVLKPSWPCRDFLTLEHGHPSFLAWRQSLPRR